MIITTIIIFFLERDIVTLFELKTLKVRHLGPVQQRRPGAITVAIAAAATTRHYQLHSAVLRRSGSAAAANGDVRRSLAEKEEVADVLGYQGVVVCLFSISSLLVR